MRSQVGSDQEAGVLLSSPGVFTPSDLDDHIQDLLRQFSNTLWGTVHRVGRDEETPLWRPLPVSSPAPLGMHWEESDECALKALS